MSHHSESSFLFVVCQAGAEPVLKKEITREHPDLKFAYSRPGFVTFKSTVAPLPSSFELRSVFARAYGLSLPKLTKKPDAELAQEVLHLFQKEKATCIHVWERNLYMPGEEPKGYVSGLLQARAVRELELKLGDRKQINRKAKKGELVLDVILVEEDEWWVGLHEHGSNHSSNHSPYPGGDPEVSLPSDAPSRAYVKLEEGLIWSDAPIRKGDVAVEVGSSPGGASFALLKRGLSVVGIDPAAMAPIVLAFPGFRHVQMPVAAVYQEDLPSSVQWLLLDMNVTPSVSLYAIDKLATRWHKHSLLGVFLTVKLNQWKIADEIPSMIQHIRSMGMAHVKCTQLPNNRQEIFIYGLTSKGMARVAK